MKCILRSREVGRIRGPRNVGVAGAIDDDAFAHVVHRARAPGIAVQERRAGRIELGEDRVPAGDSVPPPGHVGVVARVQRDPVPDRADCLAAARSIG